MKSEQTDGKWLISSSTMILNKEARLIANCSPLPIPEITIGILESTANAKRIVACVNACDRISNEALEDDIVGDMVRAIRSIQFASSLSLAKSIADNLYAKLEGK